MEKHIVIVGNGISGVTAARFIRKQSSHKVTIISDEEAFFFSRTALMYVYMGHMRKEDLKPYEDWFWKKNKIDLLKDLVTEIDFDHKRLRLRDSKEMTYDQLILAIGSIPNKFNWSGQDLKRVGRLYHMQDLDYMESCSSDLNRAVIVGGGLIGIEMAEMFHSRNIPVTFLVREQSYWDHILPPEESAMINRHILKNGIDLRLGVNLGSIEDSGSGEASAVIIKETGERIPCGYVGLTAGVSPNINWLKHSRIETDRGIVVDKHLQTNIPDVYAIGDCAQLQQPDLGRKSIEAIWYTGRMMGETIAHTICGRLTEYHPGIWFNSAKFFDIEYQVYGEVSAKKSEEVQMIYWEHHTGEKSIRINYHQEEGHVTGFNLMGIRYRHEVCEQWLEAKTPIEEVLKDLKLANFDPEFYEEYEDDVLSIYQEQTGKKITMRSSRKLDKVLRFLHTKNHKR